MNTLAAGPLDYTATSPWRAPGSAPVFGSGCGMAGGGPYRESDGGTASEFGFPQNMDGKDLPPLGTKTAWKRGTAVEVCAASLPSNLGFDFITVFLCFFFPSPLQLPSAAARVCRCRFDR